ncbi:hypothetical protein L596_009416 [Steinernema carpocapsae]|uniref:Uncharacterized protein n=1 Tax=Steinernema carpocapsae TaxID=34508 RepID=A0A4U5PFA3_STECR|nr:hypothetical protein L596_009416 [Steinernema carpocapsae]
MPSLALFRAVTSFTLTASSSGSTNLRKPGPACRAECSSKNLIRLFLDSQNTSESPEAQAVRLEGASGIA